MTIDQVTALITEYRDGIGKDRKPLKAYDREDQMEIRAEERGQLIACDVLIQKIRRATGQ